MKHHALFLLNEQDFAVFEKTAQYYMLLSPLLYEPEGMGAFVKNQLINVFFALYKHSDSLFINTGLSFFQAFQTAFVERIITSNFLKQNNRKLQGQTARCYITALFISQYMSNIMTQYIIDFPEKAEEVRLLIDHVHTDKEALFNERFQAIQSHPRDLMVADANLVKYFTAIVQTEPYLFENALKQAYQFADELYETVFMAN